MQKKLQSLLFGLIFAGGLNLLLAGLFYTSHGISGAIISWLVVTVPELIYIVIRE